MRGLQFLSKACRGFEDNVLSAICQIHPESTKLLSGIILLSEFSFTNESPEPKLFPTIAPMVGILAKGEALVRLSPPLDMLDTMFGLVRPDFSLPSEPKSLVSGISTVPRGEVTVGMAEAASLSSSMSTSPELKLGISNPLKPRAKTASAGFPPEFAERDELKTELRCSDETRLVDSLLMEVRFCISERLPFSSARFDLTSGFASWFPITRPERPLKHERGKDHYGVLLAVQCASSSSAFHLADRTYSPVWQLAIKAAAAL